MKSIRSRSGPFVERPFYQPGEIERICTEELHSVGLYPPRPEAVRVERFIERRFHISPTYEDLPDGILGYSRFNADGVEAIVISRKLCDEGSRAAERRVNTTLAHEGGGHALLHAHLFVLGEHLPSLFGGDKDVMPRRILCREGEPAGERGSKQGRYRGRWWEFQANQAMGALLLPRQLVHQCLEGLVQRTGEFGRSVVPATRREEAAGLLAEVFDVNRVVARIRLGELYPGLDDGQLHL